MTGSALVVLLVAQSFHVSLNGKPRMVVIDALHEAYELLDRPACVGVFDEFRDRTGSRVSQMLLAAGRTPREWLLGLYFVEGDAARCRADPSMAAYTLPGSRVVWICGDRFAERFAMAVRPASYLVIHEVLHTTGLGENPPSSAQITAAVARSCGG